MLKAVVPSQDGESDEKKSGQDDSAVVDQYKKIIREQVRSKHSENTSYFRIFCIFISVAVGGDWYEIVSVLWCYRTCSWMLSVLNSPICCRRIPRRSGDWTSLSNRFSSSGTRMLYWKHRKVPIILALLILLTCLGVLWQWSSVELSPQYVNIFVQLTLCLEWLYSLVHFRITTLCGYRGLICPRNKILVTFIERLCVNYLITCFLLLLVTYFVACIFFFYLLLFIFSFENSPVHFPVRCHKWRLNLGYNLSQFIFIVVFLCLMICISLI